MTVTNADILRCRERYNRILERAEQARAELGVLPDGLQSDIDETGQILDELESAAL